MSAMKISWFKGFNKSTKKAAEVINNEENKPYKDFLTYDQSCEFGIEYGDTMLSYRLDREGGKLLIHKYDSRDKRGKDIEYDINSSADASDKQILTDFLVQLFSHRYNFYGHPLYSASPIFNKVEFLAMLDKGIQSMQLEEDRAKLKFGNSDFIRFCNEKKLFPRHYNRGVLWEANCPQGAHSIQISVESGTWGCGYCKRKGDLESFKQWYTQVKENKALR